MQSRKMAGTVLSANFDSVEEFKELGISLMHAKAMMKLLVEWRSHGLPVKFLSYIESTTVSKDKSYFAPVHFHL